MKFEILSPSDLLPYAATTTRPAAYDSLTPAEKKEYDKAVAEFVAKFNAEHPEGMQVRLRIQRLNFVPNKAGRVAIVVAADANYNATSLTYSPEVANLFARNFGLPTFASLASILTSVGDADPSYITFKVKAVTTADTYTRGDGKTATYKAPTMAIIDREELQLSKSALAKISRLTETVDMQEMLAFRQNLYAPATVTPAVPANNDDADVIGG